MKNLFIAKNITEVDHFLPLMRFLIYKKESVSLEIININIDRKNLETKFSTELLDGIEIKNFFFSNSAILKKFDSKNINFKNLYKNFSFKNICISLIKFSLFGKLKLCKILLNKKILYTKIKLEKPTRVFIDNNFEVTGYYNTISNICKKQRILLFELPHSLTLSKRKILKKNKNLSNIQVYNSKYEIDQFVDEKKNFKVFGAGSFKYDKWWQDIIISKFFIARKRKNLLYVMTDHNEKNFEKEAIFIKKMVEKFDSNFFICPPSRDSYSFFYKYNHLKRFEKFFDFSSSLFSMSQNANILLTTISGGIVDGIYNLKPIIFLKFLIDDKNYRELVFDKYDCFENVYDYENLYKLIINMEKKNFLTFSKKKKYINFLNQYILFNNSRKKLLKNFYKTIVDYEKK